MVTIFMCCSISTDKRTKKKKPQKINIRVRYVFFIFIQHKNTGILHISDKYDADYIHML